MTPDSWCRTSPGRVLRSPRDDRGRPKRSPSGPQAGDNSDGQRMDKANYSSESGHSSARQVPRRCTNHDHVTRRVALLGPERIRHQLLRGRATMRSRRSRSRWRTSERPLGRYHFTNPVTEVHHQLACGTTMWTSGVQREADAGADSVHAEPSDAEWVKSRATHSSRAERCSQWNCAFGDTIGGDPPFDCEPVKPRSLSVEIPAPSAAMSASLAPAWLR